MVAEWLMCWTLDWTVQIQALAGALHCVLAFLHPGVYSQLSPCGHPAITDTCYYVQNSDPIYGGLTENDSQYYGFLLFLTQKNIPMVSAIID